MNKVTLNDWMTLQTRKDLSLLRKSIKREPIRIAILIDVAIAVISTCLDGIYSAQSSDQQVGAGSPSILWWIIAGIVILVTVGGIVLSVMSDKRKAFFRKISPTISELVDVFDNEVCYNIMTADSMDDHLIVDEDTKKLPPNDEVQKFYFIETCYYLNKAISQLEKFEIQGKEAIFRGENGNGISLMRFVNVCTLIHSNYLRLITIAGDIKEYTDILKQSNKFIDMFNSLINSLEQNEGFTELKGCEITDDGSGK